MSDFYNLEVIDLYRTTDECIEIKLEIPSAIEQCFYFKSGQYITIESVLEGKSIRRAYSICSSPNEKGFIKVLVKKIPSGLFSNFANNKLKIGDRLNIQTPKGDFCYTPKSDSKILGIACGSGITPIFSMIKNGLESNPSSTHTLLYSNKTKNSTIYYKELLNLKEKYPDRLKLYFILTQEKNYDQLFSGRIDDEKINLFFDTKIISQDSKNEIYICGPQQMAENTIVALEKKGISKENIYSELFYKESKVDTDQAIDNDTHEIIYLLNGRGYPVEYNTEEPNILEAGLNDGLDLSFSCKSGVCSSCKAKVLKGEVTSNKNDVLSKKEIEQGYILACQSKPKSNKLEIDFDIY